MHSWSFVTGDASQGFYLLTFSSMTDTSGMIEAKRQFYVKLGASRMEVGRSFRNTNSHSSRLSELLPAMCTFERVLARLFRATTASVSAAKGQK